MKKKYVFLLAITSLWTLAGLAQTTKDSIQITKSLTIDEVVVTGTRNETDIRHLPMTISVVDRKLLEQSYQSFFTPHPDGTSTRTFHNIPGNDGIWCIDRCCRRYESAWHRW